MPVATIRPNRPLILSTDPVTALSIIHAVKPVMVDSDDFDKAENRLANDLTGVKPSEAATKGKALLRLLVASSPELDSASAFLPQRRAVFVLRHVETWLAADDFDDEDAELQLRLVELFSVLAPIVQSEQGGFWETIFDVLENNIADVSLTITPFNVKTVRSLTNHSSGKPRRSRSYPPRESMPIAPAPRVGRQQQDSARDMDETGRHDASRHVPLFRVASLWCARPRDLGAQGNDSVGDPRRLGRSGRSDHGRRISLRGQFARVEPNSSFWVNADCGSNEARRAY